MQSFFTWRNCRWGTEEGAEAPKRRDMTPIARVLILLTALAGAPSAVVVVRFDGSLRYPLDPGFPTSSLGRMAACAACIFLQQNNDETTTKSRSLVAMGGKNLCSSVSSKTTSAEVEYEGLLFGLEGLKDYLLLEDIGSNRSVGARRQTPHDVIIQGDCKNVMEQMKGSARPRKLEAYHKRATEIMLDNFSSCRFQFQHIPRGENVLCDRTSALILAEQQDACYQTIFQELDLLWMVAFYSDVPSQASAEIKQALRRLLSQHFSRSGTSYVPISQRPPFYQRMAEIAALVDDYECLLDIGERFEHELKSVWHSSFVSRRALGPGSCNLLSLEAVVYQTFALESLGKHKKVKTLQRTNRFLLEKYHREGARIQERLVYAAQTNSSKTRPSASSILVPQSIQEIEEWPLLVRQWHSEALQSKSWNDTSSFWTQQDILSQSQ